MKSNFIQTTVTSSPLMGNTPTTTILTEDLSIIRPLSIFHNSRAQSLPTLNLAFSGKVNSECQNDTFETFDLTQIVGPSRITPTIPEYSNNLLNTLQYNNASAILSLPYLALPPFSQNFHHDPRKFSKCAVCDEIATGRHYGAPSCFGCKSFWRRSIYCQRKYRCKFEAKCELKKTPHQNLCRACRLRKCFEVGMNPEAIQLEREQSVPSQLDLLQFDHHQPMIPLNNVAPIFKFIRDPIQLANHHEQICQKIDTFAAATSVDSKNNQIKTINFEMAFFNPTILCHRTKLNPTGIRIATINDIIDDSKRCFVLYSDWLQPLAEFQHLSKEDQIILGKKRFSVFHWWICSVWTIETKQNYTFCYSNGSYFPLDSNFQCIYDSYNMIEKMYKLFIEPLKVLHLSIPEYCLLFVIAFFHQEPLLSPSGQQHIQKCYNNFVKLLYELILESKRSTGFMLDDMISSETHFETAKRMAEIMGLVKTLYTCTVLNLNKDGSLPDILHIE